MQKYILIFSAFAALASNAHGGTAPTLSPSTDQYVAIDVTGKTFGFSASGGTCDPPPGDCGWTTDGPEYYVWGYDTLIGKPAAGATPAQGETNASLALNEDKAGKTQVSVVAMQKWKDRNGNAGGPTSSPASNAVLAKVQKPTSIDFAGSVTLPSAGGTFKFKVYDQDGELYKSKPVTIKENFTINYTVRINGRIVDSGTAGPFPSTGNGVANTSGATDASGITEDTPVGQSVASLQSNATNHYGKGFTQTSVYTHHYPQLVGPDGDSKSVQINFDQTQTIIQRVVLDPDPANPPTVTTISVSP